MSMFKLWFDSSLYRSILALHNRYIASHLLIYVDLIWFGKFFTLLTCLEVKKEKGRKKGSRNPRSQNFSICQSGGRHNVNVQRMYVAAMEFARAVEALRRHCQWDSSVLEYWTHHDRSDTSADDLLIHNWSLSMVSPSSFLCFFSDLVLICLHFLMAHEFGSCAEVTLDIVGLLLLTQNSRAAGMVAHSEGSAPCTPWHGYFGPGSPRQWNR